MAGVALKINMKLGGDNMILSGNVATWLPAVARCVYLHESLACMFTVCIAKQSTLVSQL